ncbi:MAG: nitroreductase/quinone reductase family protein [Chloroflexota bacterium]|nr:nitroreductase/quinone reductase family protein [Chloroflexota bacterium]
MAESSVQSRQPGQAEARRDPRFIRLVNKVIRPLLRSPLHGLLSKRLMLLTFTGRKSGKRYTLPVAYVQEGDTLLLGTETPWYKNLRGGVPVSVRLRGRERAGVAEVIDDEEGMREGYRTILTRDPGYSRFVNVTLGPDGQPNRDEVRRARERGLVVIRVRLG